MEIENQNEKEALKDGAKKPKSRGPLRRTRRASVKKETQVSEDKVESTLDDGLTPRERFLINSGRLKKEDLVQKEELEAKPKEKKKLGVEVIDLREGSKAKPVAVSQSVPKLEDKLNESPKESPKEYKSKPLAKVEEESKAKSAVRLEEEPKELPKEPKESPKESKEFKARPIPKLEPKPEPKLEEEIKVKPLAKLEEEPEAKPVPKVTKKVHNEEDWEAWYSAKESKHNEQTTNKVKRMAKEEKVNQDYRQQNNHKEKSYQAKDKHNRNNYSAREKENSRDYKRRPNEESHNFYHNNNNNNDNYPSMNHTNGTSDESKENVKHLLSVIWYLFIGAESIYHFAKGLALTAYNNMYIPFMLLKDNDSQTVLGASLFKGSNWQNHFMYGLRGPILLIVAYLLYKYALYLNPFASKEKHQSTSHNTFRRIRR